MRRFLRENAPLKAASLLIATLLWASVGTGQLLERRETVRLEFAGLPPGLVLGPGARGQVSVVFHGRREVLRDLDPEVLKAVVSIRPDAKPGTDIVVVPRVRDLPRGVVADVPAQTLRLVTAPSNGR
jgi:hypothetical protein